MYFFYIHIFEIGNIAFSLILFNETGADNTGRNSNDTNPQISDADCIIRPRVVIG